MQPDVELRCPSGELHGILKGNLVEFRCKNVRCKQGQPVVVYHYYDPVTGVLKDTKRFRDPVERLMKNEHTG